MENKLAPGIRPSSGGINGIGGRAPVAQGVIFPIAIAGHVGEIISSEIDEDVPMLISHEHQAQMDMTIITRKYTIDIGSIGVHDLPLVSLPGSNHPTIDLLDFQGAEHPWSAHLTEGEAQRQQGPDTSAPEAKARPEQASERPG